MLSQGLGAGGGGHTELNASSMMSGATALEFTKGSIIQVSRTAFAMSNTVPAFRFPEQADVRCTNGAQQTPVFTCPKVAQIS